MGPDSAPLRAAPVWVVVLDVTAKVLLVLAVTQVALDPTWGNLEGKAPGTRALTYPMLALVLPLAHLWHRPAGPCPWEADLLLTLTAFSDILGNRLDLYDQLVWFDDLIHLVNTGFFAAACVILLGAAHAPLRLRVEVAIASGMTLSLLWELWEYVAFVTSSSEWSTAYEDTIGDLTLGWLGCFAAALLLGLARPQERAAVPQHARSGTGSPPGRSRAGT